MRTPHGQTYERSEYVLTAWSTTPLGAPERAPRTERGFPAAEKISLLHESVGTRLPREGAAERLRELPSAAEYSHVAPLPAKPTTPRVVSAHCVEHYPAGCAGASTASGEGLPIGRRKCSDYMSLPVPGSLARELPRG